MNSWPAHDPNCRKAGDGTAELDDSFLPRYRPRQTSKAPSQNLNCKIQRCWKAFPAGSIKVAFNLKQAAPLVPM